MLTDDLADLAIFAAVAEARSFTRAGTKLGKSQSSLSQSVKRLEDRLKLRLLTRTTRSVMPTAAGEQLLEALAPALGNIEARLAAISELRDSPSGFLRLTSSVQAARDILWPAVLRLTARYPDIAVEVDVSGTMTDIVAERFDAGVRLGEQVAKDMIAMPIGPDLRMAVVATPSYFASHGVPARPHDLVSHICVNVRLPTKGVPYAWEFERDGRTVNVDVHSQLMINDLDLLLETALQGRAVAMVMEDMIAPQLAEGRLQRVLQDWCPAFSGYHIYYPNRRHHAPAFAALLDELRP
ncbi:LysR family transcriptional regulator [Novosphingobium sp. AP12]|uniref:LysR family transcriptional regulator n=1 Tax=Novosphingobium sp. AP12 TaxID=1144305 RepID=UPI00027200A3|nr:LysR family transcriptional regulator [Novosphingobium sp. AP12]EJL22727.1 transcriptional regulator [Novosphingobium sp. AP12]